VSAETVAAQAGLAAIKPGMAVETFGLRQDWTVLALTLVPSDVALAPVGLLLAVRDHRYHPFVIELVYMDGGHLVAYQGAYHPTLQEALHEYLARHGRIDGTRA